MVCIPDPNIFYLSPVKRFWHRLIRTLGWAIGTGLFLLFAMEMLFRGGCFDPYATEWRYLNANRLPPKQGKKVLVMGDSFTASPDNYVDELQKKLPNWQFFNSAVPGTGIWQANLIAENRFEEVEPDVFIYQIYVGNDLFDLRYPVNWETLGVARNLYWSLANHFRSLNWLNYKLGQWRAKEGTDAKKLEKAFSPQTYSTREKMLLRAEPNLIEAQSHLLGRRKEDMETYLYNLGELLDLCEKKNCEVILLVVPHCSQTRITYRQRMEELGASFEQEFLGNRPFVEAVSNYCQDRKNVSLYQAEEDLRGTLTDRPVYYYENDPHLNAEGHKMLAEVLAKLLK